MNFIFYEENMGEVDIASITVLYIIIQLIQLVQVVDPYERGDGFMFDLDLRSRKPIYEQLMDSIKDSILYGVLAPDEQLPSVRLLSSQLIINPNTVQKAYRELEREGFIYSLPGKGSFVTPISKRVDPDKASMLRAELERLLAEAVRLGLTEKDIVRMYQNVLREERSP
jgi:GntR family transcriptional regulator